MSINATKISAAEFKRVVHALGGSAGAAKAARVGEAAVDAHQRFLADPYSNNPALGIDKIIDILAAAGELQAPPSMAAREAPAWFNVDQLRAVRRFTAEDPDGFQRRLNVRQVAEIEALVRAGKPMPAVQVGRLPDGTLVEMDGGHRIAGTLRAGGPGINVEIIPVRDLNEARELFLLWNTKRRVVGRRDRLGASRNRPAQMLKSLTSEFSLSEEQALGLGDGLIGKRGMDLVDPDAQVSKDAEDRGRIVCAAWARGKLWGQDRAYSSKRALHALGVLSRDFSIKPSQGQHSLEQALACLRDRSGWWTANGTCRKLLDDTTKSPRVVAEQLTLLVNRHLNGGNTGFRQANRSRARAHRG